ncbi:hypothetical protein DFA_08736 [Cavenderia fasciculata]|uniref:Uncharacterized protein n=1 Tax=Cavenderia fasciculata TaxID=261658 RepID=F4Q3Y1_CACFS|nr:uncharacterized protein DFA_08736 [Cavenderia fasciculata]EGG17737.1 hypothetical protein DFA_08736 [Cavenderia fasciculata]|eukprot:XP_004356221.1 hypothetical protein DFA_08736 [Cavenderia fasciculata]
MSSAAQTITASPAAVATTTTITTPPTGAVFQPFIGNRVKPTYPLRQVQRGDQELQSEVLRSFSISKHGRGIKMLLDPKGEKIYNDGTVFMATRDYSCLNIIRKMHKEAKDGKKNHFTKTHSFILIPFFKRILSSVSPFHTASQLRDFGFKFANGAFTNANKHAKQYGPGRNIRAEEYTQFCQALGRSDINKTDANKKKIMEDIKEFYAQTTITEPSSKCSTKNQKDANNKTVRVSTPIRKLLCPSIAQAYAYYVEFIAKKYKDCSDNDEKTPIHRSTFYKFVPSDVKIFNNRTDTCPYCHLYDVLKAKAEKTTLTEKEDTDFKTCKIHKEFVEKRKKDFEKKKESLTKDQVIVLMDFKENIALGMGPEELSQNFYGKPQRSILGMVIYHRDPATNEVVKEHFDVFSDVLNHCSSYVIHSIKLFFSTSELFKARHFSQIFFWSDGAKHFKSAEILSFCIDLKKSPSQSLNRVEWQFSAQYHGKSDVDRHFADLSNITAQQSKCYDIYTGKDFIKGGDRCYKIKEFSLDSLKHYDTYKNIAGFSDYNEFMYMGTHEVNYELDPIRFTYKFLSQKVKVGQEIDIKRGFKEVGVEEAQVVKLKQRMVNATKIKLNIQSSSSSSSTSSTEQYDEKTRISELKSLNVKQLKVINKEWTFRSKALKGEIIDTIIKYEKEAIAEKMALARAEKINQEKRDNLIYFQQQHEEKKDNKRKNTEEQSTNNNIIIQEEEEEEEEERVFKKRKTHNNAIVDDDEEEKEEEAAEANSIKQAIEEKRRKFNAMFVDQEEAIQTRHHPKKDNEQDVIMGDIGGDDDDDDMEDIPCTEFKDVCGTTPILESIQEETEERKKLKLEKKILSIVKTFEQQIREGKNNITIDKPASKPQEQGQWNLKIFSMDALFSIENFKNTIDKIIQLLANYFKGYSLDQGFNISLVPIL